MNKLNVCILFGGISPEHAVSLRSAESVLNNIDHSKYNVFPVGITREGKWIYFEESYEDVFILNKRIDAIKFNVSA